jgi:hypothetical protein
MRLGGSSLKLHYVEHEGWQNWGSPPAQWRAGTHDPPAYRSAAVQQKDGTGKGRGRTIDRAPGPSTESKSRVTNLSSDSTAMLMDIDSGTQACAEPARPLMSCQAVVLDSTEARQ